MVERRARRPHHFERCSPLASELRLVRTGSGRLLAYWRRGGHRGLLGELSDSSLKQYLSSLRTRGRQRHAPPMRCAVVCRRGVLAAIGIAHLDLITPKGALDNDEQATHQKSEAQEKNWVSFDEYKDMVKHLEESTNALRKKKEWNETDQRNFQEYLLTKLYTVYPLRNDFTMKIVSKQAYNKLTTEDKKGQNYLVVPAGANPQMFWLLNAYKTRKKYGQKNVDIKDPEIITSLKIWLKHRPTQTDSLFYDNGRDFGVPANSDSITKILLGASKRLLDGKSVGSSLIRHMYLSSKYADTVQEMEKDADLMGHSPGVQQTVYTKKD
eukprot:SAG22_NODE_1361_length_4620_cov_22.806901_2_plen_325_part_00